MRYTGGLEHEWIMTFHIILGMSSSQLTNSIIFQRGWKKPPTSHNLWGINFYLRTLFLNSETPCRDKDARVELQLTWASNISMSPLNK